MGVRISSTFAALAITKNEITPLLIVVQVTILSILTLKPRVAPYGHTVLRDECIAICKCRRKRFRSAH